MMNRFGIYSLVFVLATATSVVEASFHDKWMGTIFEEAGVTIIRNPKEPLHKTPILEIEEELSIGGSGIGEDHELGQVRGFVVDNDGQIYVLDGRAPHIKIFDSSGKHIRSIGQKGQGPGELDMPSAVSINRKKEELAVFELSRRISVFSLGCVFLRHIENIWTRGGHIDSKGNIYVINDFVNPEDPRFELKKLASDASLIDILAVYTSPPSPKINPFLPHGTFLLDKEENLVYGYPSSYEIHYFGAESGKVFRKVVRDYDPLEITDEGKEEKSKSYSSKVTLVFSKYHSAYKRFFMSDEGHLFVQTWEITEDGKSIHDIFDSKGRFIGRIPLNPSGMEILNGKYYALETGEDGRQIVKRYTVNWKVETEALKE